MQELEKYFVQPGYIFASQKQMLIDTVLGSCVSICLWDRQNIFGGMNHFIYPRHGRHGANARFGDVSTAHLLSLMKRMGSRQEDLVAHVVGGAQNPLLNSSIGADNVEVAKAFLNRHKIQIINMDVGGSLGRKLTFNTQTGEIIVYKCMKLRESDWYGKD